MEKNVFKIWLVLELYFNSFIFNPILIDPLVIH